MKKGWFSDLEIIEIHQKINDQQSSNNTLPGTSNINKQKQPIRKESPTSENENSTQPNTPQPNKPEQTLSQEQVKSRKFKENYKQWKDHFTIIKKHWMENSAEKNKVNQKLTYISTNNITELN